MKTKCLALLLAATALVLPARAADLITESFQKALFEEEANQNLDAAIQAYRAVVTATDAQRKLAATAVFRLGECYRKLGQTNAAVAQYQRLLRDFLDQTNLVTLSQQNLVGLGVPATGREIGPGTRVPSPASRREQQRLLQEEIRLAEQQLDILKRQIQFGVAPTDASIAQEREILVLRRQLAALDTEPAPASETAAPDAGSTDDEDKEIRRIQALIQNSPDLINGAGAGGQTPLMVAALRGHLAVARFLLAAKADVNTHDELGATALHYAVKAGQKTMTELLLAHGASVNAQDKYGKSPLFFAVEKGFRTVAEVLIEHKADVHLKDTASRTPLLAAAAAGQLELADFLLRQGADVNARDTDGSTPLHSAASNGRDTVVTLLLQRKAEVDAKNNGGLTPLGLAVVQNQPKTAHLLLKAGADTQVRVGGTPLLHIAIERSQTEILKLLLAHQPDLEAADPSGYTPLQLAVTRFNHAGAAESVRLLLEAGADPNRPYNVIGDSRVFPAGAANKIDTTGCSPLVVASFLGDIDIVKSLLAHGAEVNARSSIGMTPLLYAVEKRSMPMLEAILAHQPDPELRNRTGYTALALAIGQGETKIAEKLIQAGANVNAEFPDAAMSTLLHMAVLRRSEDLVEALLATNAAVNVLNKQGQTPLDLAQDSARRAAPGERDVFAAMAASLLKHGADETFTLRSHIAVGRGERGVRARVFTQGTNAWNRHTLLELIAVIYANPDTDPAKSLLFPDLSRVTIDRLGNDREPNRSFTVDVATVLNSGDCTNAPWLEWGDRVTIPELDHPVNEAWSGLAQSLVAALRKCLQREVEILVKGQSRKVVLAPVLHHAGFPRGVPVFAPPPDPKPDNAPIRLSVFRLNEVLRASGLLRVSSDLSRVRVNRTDPLTGQPVQWIVNLSSNQPYDARTDLWLRDGDAIEVPEK